MPISRLSESELLPSDTSPLSTSSTNITVPSTPTSAVVIYAQTNAQTNTQTTTGAEVPLAFMPPSVRSAHIPTSVKTMSTPGTFRPVVTISSSPHSHPISTPVAEYQDLAPRSLQFMESPSFIDVLEDICDHTQEEHHTNPITAHHVYSKDSSLQVDGISLENSDLPLRSIRDDHCSQSTAPGMVVAMRDPRQSRISINVEPSLPGQQHLLHNQSGSTDPFLTDKTSSTSKFYPTSTARPLSGEEDSRMTCQSLVLESEQDALQKAIVGVVNIRPCDNDTTGAAEDSKDVSLCIHVLPESTNEVNLLTLEKLEAEERGTSGNLERYFSIQ